MTKSQLLNNISSRELTEWMALWSIRNKEKKEAAQRQRAAGRGRQGFRRP